jgi:hypothetical protein
VIQGMGFQAMETVIHISRVYGIEEIDSCYHAFDSSKYHDLVT